VVTEEERKVHLGEWRKHRGYTQVGLAKAAGISRQTVVSIEIGRTTKPHPLTLKVLASVLSVELDELYMKPGQAHD
jgi:DNA-binding XRE family transcriptional regulator